MSIRLYVGNLPQSFDQKELEGLFAAVGAGVRFKAVMDRETGGCRGFGFVNLDDPKLSEAVIEQFNGREYGGNKLRVEVSERRESRGNDRGGDRRNQGSTGPIAARKSVDKVVHSDGPAPEAPDPRWAGELSKLKDLLANQKASV
ncbi:MAG: RNA-binding protein [Synechococcus sp. MED-G71]|nr:MAG: RNA-binding protein [Synechococcus sp. MED-G71]RPF77015.1 MAG: RNA-binding protein [Synechococcus sp. TMED155]|tara:strand:- start:286 stop:720 length:435 start_codon:yes stop_codon:yes gene_type:complete